MLFDWESAEEQKTKDANLKSESKSLKLAGNELRGVTDVRSHPGSKGVMDEHTDVRTCGKVGTVEELLGPLLAGIPKRAGNTSMIVCRDVVDNSLVMDGTIPMTLC